MVDVGDGNPAWVRSGRKSDLTKVLAVRSQIAAEEEQRELGCDAHGGATGELNSEHARLGSASAI